MRFFALLILALTSFGSPARAIEDDIGGWFVSPYGYDYYVAAFIGTNISTEENDGARIGGRLTGNRVYGRGASEYDRGFYVGAAIGAWFLKIIRADFSVNYISYAANINITSRGDFRDRTVVQNPLGATSEGSSTPVDLSGASPVYSTVTNPTDFGPSNSAGDIEAYMAMLNGYVYPLQILGDIIPVFLRNIYIGGGVGVGLWSFDFSGVGNSLTLEVGLFESISAVAQVSAGYEIYLADFSANMPKALRGLSLGISYQFLWGGPSSTLGKARVTQNNLVLTHDTSVNPVTNEVRVPSSLSDTDWNGAPLGTLTVAERDRPADSQLIHEVSNVTVEGLSQFNHTILATIKWDF